MLTLKHGIMLLCCFSLFCPALPLGAEPGPVLPFANLNKIRVENVSEAIFKGIKINPQKPWDLEFVGEHIASAHDRAQLKRLIKYFLGGLTLQESDLWVNLSLYEKDRIIPEAFAQTAMGRDVLSQDLELKRLISSLLQPQHALGKTFWRQVYLQARQQGLDQQPLTVFHKFWIVPDLAQIYEGCADQGQQNMLPTNHRCAFITQSRLKVMLDRDYQAQGRWTKGQLKISKEQVSMDGLLRDLILPALENEVNQGRQFIPIRQAYHSLILAMWYREKMSSRPAVNAYVDKRLIAGTEHGGQRFEDIQVIYRSYVRLLNSQLGGVLEDDRKGQVTKYVSGGFLLKVSSLQRTTQQPKDINKAVLVLVRCRPSQAMITEKIESDLAVFSRNNFQERQNKALEMREMILRGSLSDESVRLYARGLLNNLLNPKIDKDQGEGTPHLARLHARYATVYALMEIINLKNEVFNHEVTRVLKENLNDLDVQKLHLIGDRVEIEKVLFSNDVANEGGMITVLRLLWVYTRDMEHPKYYWVAAAVKDVVEVTSDAVLIANVLEGRAITWKQFNPSQRPPNKAQVSLGKIKDENLPRVDKDLTTGGVDWQGMRGVMKVRSQQGLQVDKDDLLDTDFINAVKQNGLSIDFIEDKPLFSLQLFFAKDS